MDIVFVGQCEVFVSLDFVEIFFPLTAKLLGPRSGCQFFKKMSILPTPRPLRDADLKKGAVCPFCVLIYKEEEEKKTTATGII